MAKAERTWREKKKKKLILGYSTKYKLNVHITSQYK